MSAGKGDRYRSVDLVKYEQNYDKIFRVGRMKQEIDDFCQWQKKIYGRVRYVVRNAPYTEVRETRENGRRKIKRTKINRWFVERVGNTGLVITTILHYGSDDDLLRFFRDTKKRVSEHLPVDFSD